MQPLIPDSEKNPHKINHQVFAGNDGHVPMLQLDQLEVVSVFDLPQSLKPTSPKLCQNCQITHCELCMGHHCVCVYGEYLYLYITRTQMYMYIYLSHGESGIITYKFPSVSCSWFTIYLIHNRLTNSHGLC